MLGIRRIPCPIDFSSASNKALETARDYAVHFSSELLFVHVVKHHTDPVPPSGMTLPIYYQRQMQQAEASVKKAADRFIGNAVPVQIHVKSGDPAYEIASIGRKESADLIVIATHGESVLHKLLFGSVAEKVIRLAPCPLLVIRTETDDTERPNTTRVKRRCYATTTACLQDFSRRRQPR